MAEENMPSVFGGGVSMVNPDQLMQALDDSAQKDPRGAAVDGSDYASFTGKRGVYEIGRDKLDADPEELWVVDISRFQDGWICWKGGRAMATRMYPLGQPVPEPDRNEHGPFSDDGDGWYQAKGMVLKSIDTGQQIYFKNNSVSGVSEMAKLQKAVVSNLRAGLACWPVVSLKKEKFQSQGKTNYKPIFEIDGWLSHSVMGTLAKMLESDEEVDMDALYAESTQSPTGGIEQGPETEPAEAAAATSKPVASRRKRI